MTSANAEIIFTATDRLFQNIAYRPETHTRSLSGILRDQYDLPNIPITVNDKLLNVSRVVIVSLQYLLSDGTRVDQAVDYTMADEAESPLVDQRVYFGNNWGREVPYQPFFDHPMPPLMVMQKAIDTAREYRSSTDPTFRNEVWRIG